MRQHREGRAAAAGVVNQKAEDVVVANVSKLTIVWRRMTSLSVCAATGAVLLAGGTSTAMAQGPSGEAEQVRSRQRISMMEGALERAVSNGAENMLRKVRSVMPDPPMLTGAPRVRGFRLDGYGVFFDVEVPALRMPLTWTMRYMLDERRAALNQLLSELRRLPVESPNRERLDVLVRRAAVSSPRAFLCSRALIAVAYPWLTITMWFSAEALGIAMPNLIVELAYANVATVLGIYLALRLEEALDGVEFRPATSAMVALVFACAVLSYAAFSFRLPMPFFTTPPGF